MKISLSKLCDFDQSCLSFSKAIVYINSLFLYFTEEIKQSSFGRTIWFEKKLNLLVMHFSVKTVKVIFHTIFTWNQNHVFPPKSNQTKAVLLPSSNSRTHREEIVLGSLHSSYNLKIVFQHICPDCNLTSNNINYSIIASSVRDVYCRKDLLIFIHTNNHI